LLDRVHHLLLHLEWKDHLHLLQYIFFNFFNNTIKSYDHHSLNHLLEAKPQVLLNHRPQRVNHYHLFHLRLQEDFRVEYLHRLLPVVYLLHHHHHLNNNNNLHHHHRLLSSSLLHQYHHLQKNHDHLLNNHIHLHHHLYNRNNNNNNNNMNDVRLIIGILNYNIYIDILLCILIVF
jgi:hypothetical protein